MQALITIGQGTKKGISWFDGQKRHNLPHADCATILNEVYHKILENICQTLIYLEIKKRG